MTQELTWSQPPSRPALGEEDVDIWRASLATSPMYVERSTRLLARDEMARANKFYFHVDRDNFIVARAFLRIITGLYLGVDPRELRFDYGKDGKPSLVKAVKDGSPLEFNLTHSGKLALYAFTFGRRIGIDLEELHQNVAHEEIARRFFSPVEVDSLLSLSSADRERAFFNCWVRKEAFVKANGGGLSLDLDRFDVTLGSEQPVLLRVGWDDEECRRWSIAPVEVGGSYVAAIAVEGHDWRLRYWDAGCFADLMCRQ